MYEDAVGMAYLPSDKCYYPTAAGKHSPEAVDDALGKTTLAADRRMRIGSYSGAAGESEEGKTMGSVTAGAVPADRDTDYGHDDAQAGSSGKRHRSER